MNRPFAICVLLGGLALSSNCLAIDHSSADIQRGHYLATAGDCVACHTAVGGKPFAGGRPIATPFGTLYSPNITPDQLTGIGAWNDDQFYKAMHSGIDPSGRHLYPAFPYPYFTKTTRAQSTPISTPSIPSGTSVHQPSSFGRSAIVSC